MGLSHHIHMEPPGSEVRLVPPIGTCYFKSDRIDWTVSGDHADFSMNVTFYIYVTNVKPDEPNFTGRGGKVYIVAVYDGWIGNKDTKSDSFGIGCAEQLPTPNKIPIPGSETVHEDTRVYTIDFTQIMNMYNNGGNSAFEFPARYKRTFSLTGYRQTYHKDELGGWTLHFDDSAKTHDNMRVVNALQVYELDRLAIMSFWIWAEYITRDGMRKVTIASPKLSLDFSAATMAEEVVG